ncbi:hypothetical protein TNCV_2599131 [Trichonephila clavipes]|nr:hypothetical protein TNCV_2599131 [Trichonephila clavipes]
MELSPTKSDQVSPPPARNLEIPSQVSQPYIHRFTGWTDVLPAQEIHSWTYTSSTQAMIRRKEELVSELQTLPPCTISDCQDHKIPSTSVEEEINFVPSPPIIENKIENKNKTNSKSKKKFSKKRKQKGKDSTEEFIFPKKTARPISPTSLPRTP